MKRSTGRTTTPVPALGAGVLFVALLLAGCGERKAVSVADLTSAQPDRILAYGEDARQRIHLFLPPDTPSTARRVCIVFIHGGGWGSGEPDLLFPHAEYFARRGAVTACIDRKSVV